jgi:hypothetical protein
MVSGSRPKLAPETPSAKLRGYRERPKESDLPERLQADRSDDPVAEATQDEVFEVAQAEVFRWQVTSAREAPSRREGRRAMPASS